MTSNLTTALAAMLTMLLTLPASAQFAGTPGNAPLTPDGPRRGLGPPSINDHVPDIRLHSDQGGIPGAGPPIGSSLDDRPYRGAERASAPGRHCRTPARQCVLVRPAAMGMDCSCRVSGGRMRGIVVR